MSQSISHARDNRNARAANTNRLMQRGDQPAGNASEIYHTEPVDLILTDIVMPDGDGIELIRELCRRHRDARMIAMSGGTPKVQLDFFPLLRMLGAKVLKKPFTRKQLPAMLADSMSQFGPTSHS